MRNIAAKTLPVMPAKDACRSVQQIEQFDGLYMPGKNTTPLTVQLSVPVKLLASIQGCLADVDATREISAVSKKKKPPIKRKPPGKSTN